MICADASQLLGAHLGGLVQQHDVAELYLLDDQVLNVLLVDVGTRQAEAAAELVAHAQGVDHGDNAVETRMPSSMYRGPIVGMEQMVWAMGAGSQMPLASMTM